MAGLDFSSDWGLVVKKLKQLKKRIVVTLGAKGAYYLDNHEEGFIPAFKVACVDSTGAGDAFNAALVRELLHKNLKRSGALGQCRRRFQCHEAPCA